MMKSGIHSYILCLDYTRIAQKSSHQGCSGAGTTFHTFFTFSLKMSFRLF